MKSNAGAPRRLPALRPLTCGVMLALTTVPMASLMARDLNDEELTIEDDHNVEEWRLNGASSLTVNGANTFTIRATGQSSVALNNASVTRIAGSQNKYALWAIDDAVAKATGTTFHAGGIWAGGNGRIELTNSTVTVDDLADDVTQAWGISINGNATPDAAPSVLLDGTTVTVADLLEPDPSLPYNSGVGVMMGAGELEMRNNSTINAANVGIVFSGRDTPMAVTLDNSHIHSGRGAGIVVSTSSMYKTNADILIANGSTITAGDGTLLLVSSAGGTAVGSINNVNFTVDDSQLAGDIRYDHELVPGSVNVLLRNNASITGRFFNVTTAGVDGNSTWTMTGDSSVGKLVLGSSGTVVLSDGNGFNTLTLGEFAGEGGTLAFRSELEGDASRTDKLVITGDANGYANVTVTNAGGRGAQTINGIELIQIDGASNAGFSLLGRAVGGLYEYFLVKDANGNWYLRSQLENPPVVDPCDGNSSDPGCIPTLPVEPGPEPENPVLPVDPPVPDPVDPENPVLPVDPPEPENPVLPVDPPEPENPVLPVDPPKPERPQPVLRPETGAYLANQAAMGQLLQYSARDRGNAATADGLTTWANVDSSERRMDAVGMQRLNTQQSRLQVGAELGAFDGGQGRVGVLLSAGRAETTSRSTVTGYRADGKVEGGAAGVYAGWSHDGLYAEASLQHGRFRNQVQGEGLALERYDSRAWQTSVEAGYRFAAGRIGGMALSLEPQLQLTHTAASMDAHVESNGTVIARTSGNGWSTRVGLRLEGEAAGGRLLPYLQLDGHHTPNEGALSFDGDVLEGGAPRRRVDLQLGGQLSLGSGLSAWGGIGGSHGTGNYRDTSARVGVSYQW